ncbi:MAG: hypothetical protein S4CHLAM20_01400 [Chlamydiia bacterium]|nr:hypothetical protein [Chlamydiia bacterium]
MRHGLETGEIAPEFSLIGADGMIHTLVDYRGFKGICFCFFTLEGEESKKALDELKILQQQYKQKSIAIVGICIKQEESFRETLKALKGLNLGIDLLVDATGDLSSKFDIATTPHTFIFNQSHCLIYSGAISNGSDNYLSNALDQLIGGLPIKTPWTEPLGREVKPLAYV